MACFPHTNAKGQNTTKVATEMLGLLYRYVALQKQLKSLKKQIDKLAPLMDNVSIEFVEEALKKSFPESKKEGVC